MRKYQTSRINRRTAARLLRGAPVVVPDALADLFAAAAAPPHDGELVGERAAAEAFLEAAHRSMVPQARSRPMVHRRLRRLLTVKVAAAVAATLTVGGVATAATIGHVTTPPPGGTSAVTSSHPAAGASIAVTTTSARGTSSPARHGSPSPSLVGLCRAYTATAADHGTALDNPAFTALITAARGRAEVGAYCAALLKAKSPPRSGQGAGKPATHGRSAAGHAASTDHPTGPPATHPAGGPATHPTGAPTTHPTGGPRPHPTGVARRLVKH